MDINGIPLKSFLIALNGKFLLNHLLANLYNFKKLIYELFHLHYVKTSIINYINRYVFCKTYTIPNYIIFLIIRATCFPTILTKKKRK